MSRAVVAILLVEPVVLIAALGFTSHYLVKLERGLRHDVMQALDFMTKGYHQLSEDLRAAQQEQVYAVVERFEAIEASLAWMQPWVRHLAALHHQQPAEEFPA